MMKIFAIVFAILLASILLVVVIGYCLPKPHVAARAILLRQKPSDVFALIFDFAAAPSWRSDVQSVELLPPADGRIRYREKSKRGQVLLMESVEARAPELLVARIADPTLPFGGVWIFQISPTAQGSRLNITERGEIYNPIFRFVSRFMIGYNHTLDTYLQNVARRFGENAAPVPGSPGRI